VNRLAVILILALALGACSSPPPLIVHQSEVVIPPRSLDTCPARIDSVDVKTQADVIEVLKRNRLAYVECRSSLALMWEWLTKAQSQKTPEHSPGS
jgi:hypothetical protein